MGALLPAHLHSADAPKVPLAGAMTCGGGTVQVCMAAYNAAMALLPTITALTACRLAFAAGDAVAGRKLMGSAGLRQPAAHS